MKNNEDEEETDLMLQELMREVKRDKEKKIEKKKIKVSLPK